MYDKLEARCMIGSASFNEVQLLCLPSGFGTICRSCSVNPFEKLDVWFIYYYTMLIFTFNVFRDNLLLVSDKCVVVNLILSWSIEWRGIQNLSCGHNAGLPAT